MAFVVFLIFFVPLALLFYFLAVKSRKTYSCPSCGEIVTVEHMTAHHCGMCGAPLEERIYES